MLNGFFGLSFLDDRTTCILFLVILLDKICPDGKDSLCIKVDIQISDIKTLLLSKFVLTQGRERTKVERTVLTFKCSIMVKEGVSGGREEIDV